MTRLLHVIGSPRGVQSRSAAVAGPFIDTWRSLDPQLQVDRLDLWQEPLPAFDGDFAAAKMATIAGARRDERASQAWSVIEHHAARFTSADAYLFTVPMWNGGIPYRLKQYIDLLTQPGLLFTFDPATGYRGMLEAKRAAVIYTSGVFEPGAPEAFGCDFHSTYMEWWLNSIGIARVESIRYQPTLRASDVERIKRLAINRGRDAARRLHA